MPIKTICPSCRIIAEHPDHLRGYQAGCPFCGSPMVVGLNPIPDSAASPWGQLSLRGQGSALWVALLATAGVMLLILVIGGAGVAFTLAARNRPRAPVAAAPEATPVAEQPATEAPTPPPAVILPAPEAPLRLAVADEMIAELSEGKTWNDPAGRSVSVKYRMLKGRPGPDVSLHWVLESADGRRAVRQLMFNEIQDSGTLAGQLAFQQGDGPYTTYLEQGPPPLLRPGIRVTERVTLEETAPESVRPQAPSTIAAISQPPRRNPYTTQLEGLRRHLENIQRQKAAHDERMQRFGGRGPMTNPFERMEQDLQRQIERVEQMSQQWEQQNAPR